MSSLSSQVISYLKKTLDLDEEDLEDMKEMVDPLIQGLSKEKDQLSAFSVLLKVFEVDEEDLPLSRTQSIELWSLVNDHQRNAIGILLRGDTNPPLANSTTTPTPNSSTPSDSKTLKTDTSTQPKTEQSTQQQQSQQQQQIDPNRVAAQKRLEEKRLAQQAVQNYQTGTHSETVKKAQLERLEKKEHLDKNAAMQFLGGSNTNNSSSTSQDTRMSSSLGSNRDALTMVFGGAIDTEQELAPLSNTTQKIIEMQLKQLHTENHPPEPNPSGRGRTQQRPASPQIHGTSQQYESRVRDRNYGSISEKVEHNSGNNMNSVQSFPKTDTYDDKYLQPSDATRSFNGRVDETLPLQYKVYRGKIVEPKGDKGGKGGDMGGGMNSNKSTYHVQLTMFPDIQTILDISQVSAAPPQNRSGPGGQGCGGNSPTSNFQSKFSGPQKLQSGQDIYVKVLSDYISVFKSELQELRSKQELIRNSLGNDVQKLKNNPILKKSEPDVILNISMLDVDQSSGFDMNPINPTSIHRADQSSNNYTNHNNSTGGNPGGLNNHAIKNAQRKKQNFSGISDEALTKVKEAGKHIRESSQERWKSNIYNRIEDGLSTEERRKNYLEKKKGKSNTNPNDLQGIDLTEDFFVELSDDEHHAEVDVADIEPRFIQGFHTNIQSLTNDAMLSMSLTQMDGDLSRTARAQSEQAIERRKMKYQKVKDDVEAAMMDNKHGEAERLALASKAWKDPLSLAAQREASRFSTDQNPLKLAQQVVSGIQADVIRQSRENEQGQGQQTDMATVSANLPPLIPPKPHKVIAYGFHSNKTLEEQRKGLPIYDRRDEFLQLVQCNQICVVVAETGSGKTTQMGQYLFEAGWGNRGVIGCTQPRRVAATSVATRVAEEVGCELGSIVGYSVRFDERTSASTRIKYMTDGMLLREILLDPQLSRYSCMIIDEAHERGVNTDVLLALIKAACKQRPDLRFIVTSATLDSEKFSTYLNNCPVFEIQGRTHPVTVHYSQNPESDYFESALQTVLTLHLEKPTGDILVFLTGEEEINDAVELLSEQIQTLQRQRPGAMIPLDVYPIYSSLPSEIQTRIFEKTPPGRRKCVIATNIAEASVTIDGIVYVIDAGVCKVSVYDPKQGIESLQVTPISQAQARQRAGRAGRTQPGECYRLYTEHTFENELTPTTVPELQRCDLASVILLLKALGINDLLGFDFIDPPATSSMLLALRQLFWLGGVDDDGLLTPVGARLAMLPVSPNLGKMLLVAADLGCLDEVTTVVALVSGDELFLRPKDQVDNADKARAAFSVKDGDHATLANVFMKWVNEGRSKQWCARNFISVRALETAYNVKLQLIRTLTNMKVELSSCGKNWQLISRAVTAGLFMNAAKREVQEDKSANKDSVVQQQTRQVTMYKSLTYGNSAPIHPSSSLTNSMPGHIVYQKMLYTTKEWLHTCTVIHPQWLLQLAPHLYGEKNEQTQGSSKNKTKLTELSNPHQVPGAWRLDKRGR